MTNEVHELLALLAMRGKPGERRRALEALARPLPTDPVESAALAFRALGPETTRAIYRREFGREITAGLDA